MSETKKGTTQIRGLINLIMLLPGLEKSNHM